MKQDREISANPTGTFAKPRCSAEAVESTADGRNQNRSDTATDEGQSLMPGTRWADCGNPIGRYVQVKETQRLWPVTAGRLAVPASDGERFRTIEVPDIAGTRARRVGFPER